jgi:hypothetical protein
VTEDPALMIHVTGFTTLQKLSIGDFSTSFNFPQLTSLALTCMMEEWSPITNLTNLTKLRYHSEKLPPPEILQNFTNLTSLCLRTCKISDLLQMSQLQSLRFWETSGKHVNKITRLTNLRRLEILSFDFFMKDPSELTKLFNLTRLSLWASETKTLPILSVRGFSDLRFLDLARCDLDLSSLPLTLDTLKLDLLHQPSNSVYKKNIPVLTNLTSLELSDISVNTRKLLAPLTNLETLIIQGYKGRVLCLPPLPKLKNIILEEDEFLQGGIISGELPNLVKLSGNLPLSDENIRNFGNLENLTCYHYSESISGLTNLRELTFPTVIADKVPIHCLTGLTNLTALQIPQYICEPLRWEEWWLRKFLPNLKHFEL